MADRVCILIPSSNLFISTEEIGSWFSSGRKRRPHKAHDGRPIGLCSSSGQASTRGNPRSFQVRRRTYPSQVYWRSGGYAFTTHPPTPIGITHCYAVTGVLKGYDQLLNLVLDDVTEEVQREPTSPSFMIQMLIISTTTQSLSRIRAH